MGILRTDRVTGLGGANAIKGSVEFRADQNIQAEIVNGNADFNYGSGDFTIECWWNSGGDLSTDINFVTLWNYASDRQGWGMYWDADDGNFGLIASTGGSIGSTDISYRQAAGFEKNRWYHLAIVRISNTLTLYKDGTSIGSNSSFTGTIYENTVDPLIIGGQMNGSDESQKIMRGFISNLRIIKGEGIYTGNFTPPTSELTVTSNTVLLACQSPSNILQEATGKTLVAYRRTANSSFPVASRFTPNSPVGFSTTTDVGTQFGSTFDGVTTFDSQAYMVPPGGNTRERNRGRGVLGGGVPTYPSGMINAMMYVEIQSQGNAQDFGDLTVARGYHVAGQNSSSTRGLSSSGWTGSGVNTIDFITIANTANAIDFGDTSIVRMSGGLSNQTRGLHAGTVSPFSNVIDFVTIATTGDAQDFGDLVEPQSLFAGASSSTRGVFGGGRNNTPSSNTLYNTMQFVTIASTGNAQDFGDLQAVRYGHTGFSSPTRGIFAGGYLTPGQTTSIDFFTIATLGNSQDFGDLSTAPGYGGSVTNSIRGVVTCGDAPNYYNILEFITIATTGNASDFGDTDPSGSGKGQGDFPSCISDSHGGLS